MQGDLCTGHQKRPDQLSKEEFENLLNIIYENGADPEWLVGKCPHCHEPFEYNYGTIMYGHWPSACPNLEDTSGSPTEV